MEIVSKIILLCLFSVVNNCFCQCIQFPLIFSHVEIDDKFIKEEGSYIDGLKNGKK